MRELVLMAAMIILTGLLAAGHQTDAAPGSTWVDLQRLRELTRAEHQALVVADTSQLERLLSADFVWVMPDGESRSREQLIDALGTGDLDIWSVRIAELSAGDPIDVQLVGNVATVRYESDLEIGSHPISFRHDSSGADYHYRLRTANTDIWIRSGDTWRELRAQSTAVATTVAR